MRALSTEEVLAAVDDGLASPAITRAVPMLATALGATEDDVAALPLGERDALLLTLREAMFGPRMCATSICPACGVSAEFDVDVRDLQALSAGTPTSPFSARVGDVDVLMRAPDTRDLAAVADVRGLDAGLRALLRRCVLAVSQEGSPLRAWNVDDQAVEALSNALDAHDPLAEVNVDLRCEGCGGGWTCVVDIASSLWTELQARADETLDDVVELARAFGWGEREVLAMSDARRRAYLGRVRA